MELIGSVIVWAVFGLVVGAIAGLLYPGRQTMGILMTMALGVAGSLLGGFVGWAIVGNQRGPFGGAGWIMSIIGALDSRLARDLRDPTSRSADLTRTAYVRPALRPAEFQAPIDKRSSRSKRKTDCKMRRPESDWTWEQDRRESQDDDFAKNHHPSISSRFSP